MATIYVKKDGSGNATTIQHGIQLAQVGDVVEVEAGTFDENIDLWKGITLKGAGIDQTIITGALRSVPASKSFTWALGDTLLTVSSGDTSGYEVGWLVSATGIPANARIASKTSTTLTISDVTTQAAATARAVNLAFVNDAAIAVRGGNGVIRDMKVIGFDSPNAAIEFSALYFKNAAYGSSAANGWEIFNCEFVANGDLAILSEYVSAIGNLNFHNNIISGKTFMGANPARGNQFSVWNVPRQLVTVQGANTGVNKFMNNEIIGVTGGLAVGGVASFNTAVTFDPANSIVSGNIINGTHGYGYALRVRGVGSVVENNKNFSLQGNSNSGYLIGPTGSQVIGLSIGSNLSIEAVLVSSSQSVAGQPVVVSVEKTQLKSLPKVTASPEFSNDSSWNLVTCVFKKTGSSKRLVSASRDLANPKSMKLRPGMVSGDEFQLHRIIISKPDRSFLVLKREEIENAESFDFILK